MPEAKNLDLVEKFVKSQGGEVCDFMLINTLQGHFKNAGVESITPAEITESLEGLVNQGRLIKGKPTSFGYPICMISPPVSFYSIPKPPPTFLEQAGSALRSALRLG